MKFPHGFKIACKFAERQRWKIFEKNLEFRKMGGTTTPPYVVIWSFGQNGYKPIYSKGQF